DLVLGTSQAVQPAIGMLDRDQWRFEEMSLRDHWWAPWPPDDFLWIAWLKGGNDAQGNPIKLGRLLADAIPMWWNYYWFRKPWTDPGGFPIILLEPKEQR